MIDVTIIVCTRNRASALKKCLASISQAILRCPGRKAELIVVDNGSTDNTRDVVSAYLGSASFPVQVVDEPRPGLATARNTGLKHASGRLIAFTDDDCRMASGYISVMTAHFDNDKEPVIRGGRVELGDPTDLPFSIKLDDAETTLRFPIHPGTLAAGCNMVIHQEVFSRIGLFDERFGAGARFKAGEETEYFHRAYLNKIPVTYVPDMIVYHFHGRKTVEVVRRLFSGYATANGAMYAKYFFSRGGLNRHLYWDLRKALWEMITGRALDEGDAFYTMGLSQQFHIVYVLKGMALYWVSSVASNLRNLTRRERAVSRKHLRGSSDNSS
jgi:glycosyltransferase involved in cell wall biosynthesis